MNQTASQQIASDRRQHVRTSILWSGYLLCHDIGTDCIVLNLSAKGAKARLFQFELRQSQLTLRIARLGELRSKAVWYHGRTVGLQFLEEAQTVAEVIGSALCLQTAKP